MKDEESQNQQALFRWAELSLSKYPGLEMLYAIPNGGYRNKITAARLKREGVKAGVLDINLDVAGHGYHGLRIEMKSKKGYLTKAQGERIKKNSEYN